MGYKQKDIELILDNHDRYWEQQRSDLRRFKNVYECRFWQQGYSIGGYGTAENNMISIQTAEGYGYVESYIASLFSKNPAIVLKKGIRNMGNREKSKAVVNNFLLRARQAIENAARMALIYPMAFFKLVPQDDVQLYDRIIPVAVAPWEIIVDRDAPSWDRQRYIGHKYWMPLDEAKSKWSAKFEGERKDDFFDPIAGEDNSVGGSTLDDHVLIFELYSIDDDYLCFYCPHLQRENKILEQGYVPFRDASGKPVAPIVPLYFNRIPSKPMDGYSAVRRVYDQLFEINIIRSFQANAVRKASRQYIVKSGVFDEESMAQVTSGIDGLFVEVAEDNLDGIIRAFPHNPMPPELSKYYQDVKGDLDTGSILAPFTRGTATKATASEIAALAAYSASEIGRLARERDYAIELLAKIYLCCLATFIEEEVPSIINLEGSAEIVKADDLRGDFEFFASDQSSTPMSESIAKRQLLENIPTLTALGVPPDKLLKEVVRVLNLPEDFVEVILEEGKGRLSGIQMETETPLQSAVMGASPEKIAPFLPTG